MAGDEHPPINPNTADVDSLRQMPGVGPALAERIVAHRPYDEVDDLRRVPGLGPATLVRIAPYLTFQMEGAPQPAQAVPSTPDRESPREETPPSHQIVAVRRPAEPGRVDAFSRSQTLSLAIGMGLVSALLAVVITLAVLLGINETLDMGRHAAVRQLNADVGAVDSRLEDLSAQLAALEGRLGVMQGLSGRVSSVEEEVESLRFEVEAARTQVDSMLASMEAIVSQTEALADRAERFDAFLEGLQALLEGTQPADEIPQP